MYSLDINFLSDREAAIEAQVAAERQPIADSQFLIYGGAVAVVALGLVGGAFVVLNSMNEGVQQELTQLTGRETELKGKITALSGQEKELEAIVAKTNELVQLFVGNLPMSAVATDISRRTPVTVQVESITQASSETDSNIRIVGKATGYNELNDFLLLMQASPLLSGKDTKLISSTLEQGTVTRNFNLVNFQIETKLKELKSDLTKEEYQKVLTDLQKSGADGLVARINLLKQKGVIE
ncbi:MAG: PilN domain-containing protein [Pseudanabaenaceae cyanobacterium bins.39]|nr:PilN domain-containing protein [Pseudanabaenaceae cyanobacterium bins.39]